MTRIIFHPDGRRTVVDENFPEPAPYVAPEIAALRAEVAALRAAAITIAQRSTPMTKAQAEALLKVAVVKA
jgi:hypothetical protein